MPIQPIFTGKIYQKTIFTKYGRHIIGGTKEREYDIYIAENKDTKQIEHKLYYIREAGKWIKSRLVFFKDNRIDKEVKSQSKFI